MSNLLPSRVSAFMWAYSICLCYDLVARTSWMDDIIMVVKVGRRKRERKATLIVNVNLNNYYIAQSQLHGCIFNIQPADDHKWVDDDASIYYIAALTKTQANRTKAPTYFTSIKFEYKYKTL